MLRRTSLWLLVSFGAAAIGLSSSAPALAKPEKPELVALLTTLDQRQRAFGDYRSTVYIEQKEKGKVTTVYNALVFRRSSERKFLILFTEPKSSAGQGYLKLESNLWFYDPSVGKWERRTERERIGGTNTRRSDYDESHLADEYDPESSTEETLGAYATQVVTLRGKAGLDLAFPMLKLWVDKESKNVMKRQEFALSGRLLRTTYFPKWKKVWSESKNDMVWYAEETRSFDEVQKENSSVIVVQDVSLQTLDANVFTKAWLESKSR